MRTFRPKLPRLKRRKFVRSFAIAQLSKRAGYRSEYLETLPDERIRQLLARLPKTGHGLAKHEGLRFDRGFHRRYGM